MDRKEFEETLKRALELQSLQNISGEDVYSEEELRSAGKRLGISEVIIEQAIKEADKRGKRYRVSGSPAQVQEAFLQHFLIHDTTIHFGRRQSGPALLVDRKSIKIGSSASTRVFHPSFPDVETTISFIEDGPNHTLVKWSPTKSLSRNTYAKTTIYALIIAAISCGPVLFAAGMSITAILPLLMGIFIMAFILRTVFSRVQDLEKTLAYYFDNIRVLGEIHDQATLQKEVQELKEAYDAKREPVGQISNMDRQICDEKAEDENQEGDTIRNPPQPSLKQ